MKTLLAISPHLDDAVFSAGAFLARHAATGWRVVIATCFTASVPDPKGFALACQLDKGLDADVDYMALRRAEDVAACKALGCETVHVALPEAPHRGYDNAPALFGPQVDGDAIDPSLETALSELYRSLDPDLILGPAAIGNHIDHVIVRRVIEKAGAAETLLWADMPYATRAGFPPPAFAGHPCNGFFTAKLAAASCYRTQLGFQFGQSDDALSKNLQIDDAEWFGKGAKVDAQGKHSAI